MKGSAILFVWLLSHKCYERSRGILRIASSEERYSEESSLRPTTKSGGICIIDGEFHDTAAELASKLSIPLIQYTNIDSLEFSYALSIIPYEFDGLVDYSVAIQAIEQQPKSTKRRRSSFKPTTKPFFVDFCPPVSSRLAKRGLGESGPDLLIRAVAPRKGSSDQDDGAIIYDLTAGFGQDSLLLCKAGAKHVCMVERDPIVATLLEDALRRTRLLSEKCGNELASDLDSRLSLQVGDGREIMMQLLNTEGVDLPHIIYLDPMFPARTKSASVKKNMQILHGLLDSQALDDDIRRAEEKGLLNVAYQAAKTRVVVKRPANAELLGGQQALKPSFSIRGSVNRWDVYVKK